METNLSKYEPPPKSNDLPAVWELVQADIKATLSEQQAASILKDMRDRDESGRAKYGVPLQPFNGRNQLIDAYQELLDFVVYMRTAIYEAETNKIDGNSRFVMSDVYTSALLSVVKLRILIDGIQ